MNESARIAYCGLYCPMCAFVAAAGTRDRSHLTAMPDMYDYLKDRTLEACECAGCREQVDRCTCAMKPCAAEKGLTSCADCADFPCRDINDFGQDGAPHHAEAVRNLWRIREVGYPQWLAEMESLVHCSCGARQSWYLRCPAHGE